MAKESQDISDEALQEALKEFLKAEIKHQRLTYLEVVKMLEGDDKQQSLDAFKMTISRGKFSASFFFKVLIALSKNRSSSRLDEMLEALREKV